MREARYQWEQALTLEPEPEEEIKIRRKLTSGLPLPAALKTSASLPKSLRKRAHGKSEVPGTQPVQ